MPDTKFESHIRTTAWHRVLSESAKDGDDGASVFRMARMAASEAWQASRRAALEEAARECEKRVGHDFSATEYAELIRALANGDTK
ncbi:hypothetical protein [Pararobbsia alpina]|uniref:Uncharacterized protein n=1 Tax=Pararobbsia alpina TaxID=621374 RepID=A0A6S7CA65_9BURK|nr:hypothetical protein [Pararobbsia alpina]CAB3784685.1 hypothetical protein LMG28138_01858 [Pararobbsia alpina]